MTIQNKILLIFKGVLLYTTIIICVVSIASIDSLYDKGYLILDLALCTTLIYTCYKTLNKKDLDALNLNKSN